MYQLAINAEPVSFQQLQKELIAKESSGELLETLRSLKWRSLIEKTAVGYAQQPVVMAYMTERLRKQLDQKIMISNG